MTDQPPNPEHEKWKYEQNRFMAERAHDAEQEFFSKTNAAAITSGNHAIRALIIINGGAAIAMLAFIGQLVSVNDKLAGKFSDLAAPLSCFAQGAALATLSVMFAYLTNYCIAATSAKKDRHYEHPYIRDTPSSKHWTKAVWLFQFVTIITAAFSLLFFVLGMIEVRDAITLLDAAPKIPQGS